MERLRVELENREAGAVEPRAVHLRGRRLAVTRIERCWLGEEATTWRLCLESHPGYLLSFQHWTGRWTLLARSGKGRRARSSLRPTDALPRLKAD